VYEDILDQEKFKDINRLSEAVNLKRTDNAMAKRKRRKSDLQNTTQKTID
jgi:hypothetical protein